MQQGRGSRERPQAQPRTSQWTWESFCREEAREAASAFLERVRRFKSRHASAVDVHDSTFTNEFSAAFLEESSILMASEGETVLPTTLTTGATLTTSLPANICSQVGNGRELDGSRRSGNRNTSSVKSSWWSGMFKWSSKSKRSRERHSNENSTSTDTQAVPNRLHGGSTKQKKKERSIRIIKETAIVQLLNLSEGDEDRDGMNWSPCRLMLVQQQENYQIEIYSPPRNPMPKMSLFCFLIEEVRSTSSLEIPDSNSCFAIKSQSHGEYVFDVRAEELKEEWVRLLQAYTHKSSTSAAGNGHLPRSSLPSSHFATLPRAPSSSPHSSPLRSHGGSEFGVTPALDSSPLLVSRTQGLPPRQVNQAASASSGSSESANRHLSLSVPKKASVISTSMAPGDSEESVLVDMNSFMRNYSVTRSPNRQRKTMSMFVDPSAHISSAPSMPNPYVQAHAVNVLASPPTSHITVLESPARFPYASPQGSPPPLPKREHRPQSMYVKNARGISAQIFHVQPNNDDVATSNGTALGAQPTTFIGAKPLQTVASTGVKPTPTGVRPLPATPTSPAPTGARPLMSPTPMGIRPLSPTPAGFRPLPATPTEATPTSSRPLPATPTETTPHLSGTTSLPAIPSKKPLALATVNGQSERKLAKRKMSQPILELSSSPQRLGSMHDLPVLGSLETCSQSSSSSALHPVSIAALSKTRKNSIPFSPTVEDSEYFAGETERGGENGAEKERLRKSSAPVYALDVEKTVANGSTPSPGGMVVGKRGIQYTPSDGASIHLVGEEKEQGVEFENGDEDTAERNGSTSPVTLEDKPVFAETCSSPVTFDPSRGFCHGEEQTDHATMSFHCLTQQSSPQGLPGEERQNPSPTGGGYQYPGQQQPQTPPLPANDRRPQTPPIPFVDSTHPLSLSREGATSRNSTLSAHSISSSMDDRESSVRADSSTSNPIFVETTEGQEYNQASVHTRHPYEYWATNQQDIANLRALSQYLWFHGMISRNNASQLVLADGDRGTGQYLVRQSESREGDFVLTFNYHNRAKHLRMAVDDSGCNIQHLWFDSVLCMLEYFKTNSIPLESFWLNDDVKLTTYIDRQASDGFRTTTILNVDELNRFLPQRSRSLHLGMSRSTASGSGGSSHPGTPSLATMEHRGSSSASTNSLQSTASGWRQIFRSQRSSSAGNVGRVQRSHSHNAGSIQSTGRGGGGSLTQRGNHENAYVWKNY